MLTSDQAQAGRMRVMTGADYASQVRPMQERNRVWLSGQDFVLTGTVQVKTKVNIPYPRPDGEVTVLRRDQAAHLFGELLTALAPGGKLPEDTAELLDLAASVLREGRGL